MPSHIGLPKRRKPSIKSPTRSSNPSFNENWKEKIPSHLESELDELFDMIIEDEEGYNNLMVDPKWVDTWLEGEDTDTTKDKESLRKLKKEKKYIGDLIFLKKKAYDALQSSVKGGVEQEKERDVYDSKIWQDYLADLSPPLPSCNHLKDIIVKYRYRLVGEGKHAHRDYHENMKTFKQIIGYCIHEDNPTLKGLLKNMMPKSSRLMRAGVHKGILIKLKTTKDDLNTCLNELRTICKPSEWTVEGANKCIEELLSFFPIVHKEEKTGKIKKKITKKKKKKRRRRRTIKKK